MTPPALWPSRKTGRPGSRDRARAISAVDVVQVLGELLDVEAFAARPAAAAQVEGVDREAARRQLLAGPQVVAAVGVDPVTDGDDGLGGTRRPPRPDEDLGASARYRLFAHRRRCWMGHDRILR